MSSRYNKLNMRLSFDFILTFAFTSVRLECNEKESSLCESTLYVDKLALSKKKFLILHSKYPHITVKCFLCCILVCHVSVGEIKV